jgi:hypothetical protein
MNPSSFEEIVYRNNYMTFAIFVENDLNSLQIDISIMKYQRDLNSTNIKKEGTQYRSG